MHDASSCNKHMIMINLSLDLNIEEPGPKFSFGLLASVLLHLNETYAGCSTPADHTTLSSTSDAFAAPCWLVVWSVTQTNWKM